MGLGPVRDRVEQMAFRYVDMRIETFLRRVGRYGETVGERAGGHVNAEADGRRFLRARAMMHKGRRSGRAVRVRVENPGVGW